MGDVDQMHLLYASPGFSELYKNNPFICSTFLVEKFQLYEQHAVWMSTSLSFISLQHLWNTGEDQWGLASPSWYLVYAYFTGMSL